MDAAFLQDLVKGNLSTLEGRVKNPQERFFLLKQAGQTKRFTIVRELTSGVFVKFYEPTGQTLFSLLADGATFADDVSQSSFIGWGVPDAESEIEVFVIKTRDDVIAPPGKNPFWNVLVNKMPEARFITP